MNPHWARKRHVLSLPQRIFIMPIYEFRCTNCNKITEVMMKVTDPAPRDCSCGEQKPLEKILSRTSFVLKGEGWYETDFKKPSQKKKDPPKSDA
jgi:putative FmdB family regulatory protein